MKNKQKNIHTKDTLTQKTHVQSTYTVDTFTKHAHKRNKLQKQTQHTHGRKHIHKRHMLKTHAQTTHIQNTYTVHARTNNIHKRRHIRMKIDISQTNHTYTCTHQNAHGYMHTSAHKHQKNKNTKKKNTHIQKMHVDTDINTWRRQIQKTSIDIHVPSKLDSNIHTTHGGDHT